MRNSDNTAPPAQAAGERKPLTELHREPGWIVTNDETGQLDGREFVHEGDARPTLVAGWSWHAVDLLYVARTPGSQVEGE